MKVEEAIERLNFMIKQHICYEEVVLEDDNEDAQEELHETEIELETLRMAVRALKEKPRWIPCAERLPEMHEEVDYNGRYEESDLVLVCDATEPRTQVHVGKKRGKLSLDEIKQAAQEYELDIYALFLDCMGNDLLESDNFYVPNSDGTMTEYSDFVQLYPAGNLEKMKGKLI